MKKSILGSVIFGSIVLPVLTLAISSQTPPGENSIPSLGGAGGIIDKVKTFMWVVFGGIAVVMFVVAGIQFLTSQGDAEKVKAARSSLIWGVAGVVVGVVAYSILTIIGTALNV